MRDKKKVDKPIVKATKKESRKSIFDGDKEKVKTYIITDVIIPAFKKLIFDTVKNGLEMYLYGGTSPDRKSGVNGTYISYDSFSGKSRTYNRFDDRDHRDKKDIRSISDYQGYMFESRSDATEVLLRMEEILDMYHIVSIGDYYDLIGVQGTFTDNKYGWASLKSAEVIRIHDGYTIKLPKAMPIDPIN